MGQSRYWHWAALGCLWSCIGIASLGAAELPQDGKANQGNSDPHQNEREQIRQHHLNRLAARLSEPPEKLQERCAYESEIGLAPPRKQVVLTFDDGPEPGRTEAILATLAKHHISAAFFLIGEKAAKYPELVKKILEDGHHLVGNHSWTHPNFHAIDEQVQTREIQETDQLLASSLGSKKLFRYPYGNSTCPSNETARQLGYRIVGWHVDSCDWAFDREGSVDDKEALSCGVLPQNRNNFVEHVLSTIRAHNGGIVLMHEIHPHTLSHLEELITHIEAEGFSFASLADEDYQPYLR